MVVVVNAGVVVVVVDEVVVDIALVTVDNLLDTASNSTHSHRNEQASWFFVEKVLLVKSTKTSHVAHSENREKHKFKSICKMIKDVSLQRDE